MALVRYETDGEVAVITLDRPKVNALSPELIDELTAAVESAAVPAVRAVVITGSPHFAAGADISVFERSMSSGESPADLGVRLSEACRRIAALPKPVIAAVSGYALGGGLELAMACDFRFLAEDAQVGQPEIKLGIIPGAGGTQRLPRLVGLARAREMIYSGRLVGAAEALEVGLADRVVSSAALLQEAVAAAKEWATGPTVAIGLAKRAINFGLGASLEEGLGAEAEAFAEAFRTADAAEGISAFLAKRRPEFGGS